MPPIHPVRTTQFHPPSENHHGMLVHLSAHQPFLGIPTNTRAWRESVWAFFCICTLVFYLFF